jgi:N-acetylneuraminic acid mutarotase
MIVWGGLGSGGYLNSGARYNPATDTWTPVSIVNAPDARAEHTAIWTGSEMIIWGGHNANDLDTGARYNPATDTWSPISNINAPSKRREQTAVWTGSEMIVWGGVIGSTYNKIYLSTGGRYNPATDTWTPVSNINPPSAREEHTAVWTGSEMIIWGGDSFGEATESGGRYNPATDTWTQTNRTNDPAPRYHHTAVWTGTEMIVWGGFASDTQGAEYVNTGGRYNPATDTWTGPTNTANAASLRGYHTVIWTSKEMIVWGGAPNDMNTGGRYNPATNTWLATESASAPDGRIEHTAIWTGTEMIIWGGGSFSTLNYRNTGGRYCAASTAATPTPTPTPPPTYLISGRVTDAQGNPLGGATVNLTGAQSNTITTDDNGYYTFTNLAAGSSYMLSPAYAGFAFNPQRQSVNNMNSDATVNFIVTPSAPAPLVISEFRLSGYAGSKDEYIELYNNTDQPLTVSTTDGSSGWALATPDANGAGPLVLSVIPNGTTIPARGHFLIGNDSADGGYSLPVALDQTYSTDTSDNAGVAIFSTALPAHMTLAYRLDAAGFASMTGGTNTLYRQGSGLTATSSTSEQYAYVRKSSSGTPQVTGDNAQDFVLVSTTGTVAGAPVQLGAPGPENSASPIQRNAQIKTSLIDPQSGSTAAPNRARDATPNVCGGANCALGTLTIRRKFTNKTGQTVTALRFRIVDITTLNTPSSGGQADLRALDSIDALVLTSSGASVPVKGTTLEQPAQSLGGGLNSALVVALPAPLGASASVNVQFVLGVQQGGSFRFLVNIEAVTNSTNTTQKLGQPMK